jgi:hypothetical protein
VLVAAVLRPEQREDRELEVVRLAAQQVDDTVELLVGEAERTVDRLSDGRAQVTDRNDGSRRRTRTLVQS